MDQRFIFCYHASMVTLHLCSKTAGQEEGSSTTSRPKAGGFKRTGARQRVRLWNAKIAAAATSAADTAVLELEDDSTGRERHLVRLWHAP